jgi:hypothetical protein
MGLWQWYINVLSQFRTFPIALSFAEAQLSSVDCPYFTGNTLNLFYELNRLMPSMGLWWLYINIYLIISYYLKHDVSETVFCPHLHVASLCPLTPATRPVRFMELMGRFWHNSKLFWALGYICLLSCVFGTFGQVHDSWKAYWYQ